MKVGYERISDKDQNMARQDVLMEKLGVDRVFRDEVSGKDTERPELQRMMDFLRAGDVLIVESISRFARNTKDLLELVEVLREKKVQFISQKESIDTETPAGQFMLTVFGAVAQLERENILLRQREGIEIAKAQGKYKGRPPKELSNFEDVYNSWKQGKITAVKASRLLEISRSSFYRRVAEYEDNYIDFG